MGVYDFVGGILVGIIFACVSFVLQASTVSAIRSGLSGSVGMMQVSPLLLANLTYLKSKLNGATASNAAAIFACCWKSDSRSKIGWLPVCKLNDFLFIARINLLTRVAVVRNYRWS